MTKVDLAALRQQVRYRSAVRSLDAAFICPHGDSGTGKSVLWGMFGYGSPGTALLVQGEKGDRDLYNPDIGIIDINTLYNLGSLSDKLTIDAEGNMIGDINNMDDMALGWDMVLAITEDCFRTGGRTVNPEGIALKHIVWDSGTTLQMMCAAWVMKTTPDRKRDIGAGGQPRMSLQDFGDVVEHFDRWMVALRDLKTARNMNVVVPFLSQDFTYNEFGPDGYTPVMMTKKMPMVIGKKLPARIISYADFAPFHQMVQTNVQMPDPNNPGKVIYQPAMVRGLRWQPTPTIYAKGRGDLPPSHPLRTNWDLNNPDDPSMGYMGWSCHEYNIRKICELGNIPFDVKVEPPVAVAQ